MRRWLRLGGPWVFDGLVAGAVTYAALILTAEALRTWPALGVPGWALMAVAAVHGGVVVLRRRAPVVVLATVVVTAVGYVALGLPVYFLGPPVLVALYTLAVLRDRRTSLAGLGVAELALAVTLPIRRFPGLSSWVLYAALFAAAWLLGDNVRQRQAAAEEHERRARALEEAREELARYAVAQERLRIARELHDIVAHSMSVIALQAGTGRMVIERDAAAAREALAVIEQTSRASLSEMRQLLAVLRRDDDATRELTPAPGLADVHALVAQVVGSGVAVDVRVEGEPDGVPAGVDLAAYRIVQEALTNVLKHAGQARVTLVVRYTPEDVTIEVCDDGSASGGGAAAGGQGMVGMRERVALYGGDLRAGPREGGGFEVTARLPLRPSGA
jgi:signal transduction histidine kinase